MLLPASGAAAVSFTNGELLVANQQRSEVLKAESGRVHASLF